MIKGCKVAWALFQWKPCAASCRTNFLSIILREISTYHDLTRIQGWFTIIKEFALLWSNEGMRTKGLKLLTERFSKIIWMLTDCFKRGTINGCPLLVSGIYCQSCFHQTVNKVPVSVALSQGKLHIYQDSNWEVEDYKLFLPKSYVMLTSYDRAHAVVHHQLTFWCMVQTHTLWVQPAPARIQCFGRSSANLETRYAAENTLFRNVSVAPWGCTKSGVSEHVFVHPLTQNLFPMHTPVVFIIVIKSYNIVKGFFGDMLSRTGSGLESTLFPSLAVALF